VRCMPNKHRLEIYPSDDLLSAINRWRGKQPDIPPLATAVRRLVESALQAEGIRVAGKSARRQKAAAE
jgi:hypothetical protein